MSGSVTIGRLLDTRSPVRNLPRRTGSEEVFVDDEAGAPRVHAAAAHGGVERGEARVGFHRAHADVLELRFFLREAQRRAPLVVRMRDDREDVGALVREREILFGLRKLVDGFLQLVAADVAVARERLEPAALLAQPQRGAFSEIPRARRFRHCDRPFAVGHGSRVGFRLFLLDFGLDDVDAHLPHLLLRPRELALELARVEPEEQIAGVHAGALRRELGDLEVASGHRRRVADRSDRRHDAAGDEVHRQRAAVNRRDDRSVGPPGRPPHRGKHRRHRNSDEHRPLKRARETHESLSLRWSLSPRDGDLLVGVAGPVEDAGQRVQVGARIAGERIRYEPGVRDRERDPRRRRPNRAVRDRTSRECAAVRTCRRGHSPGDRGARLCERVHLGDVAELGPDRRPAPRPGEAPYRDDCCPVVDEFASRTVRRTVNDPVVENRCVGAASVAVPPSPKSQEYDSASPSGSAACAENATVVALCSAIAGVAVTPVTVGGLLPPRATATATAVPAAAPPTMPAIARPDKLTSARPAAPAVVVAVVLLLDPLVADWPLCAGIFPALAASAAVAKFVWWIVAVAACP